MKHITPLILSLVLLLTVMTGCTASTSKSFTFSVDNGDSIKVECNTTDNYDLSSELPFTVSCDGETLSQGTFIHGDAYEEYVAVVDSDENATLLDSGTKDGNEYIFWSYNDSEYNYAILIQNSNTGVVLGNIVSEESAKECFDRLTITAEN